MNPADRTSCLPCPIGRLLPRSAWIALLIGLLLRAASIDAPLLGNSNLRQTQTSIVTESMGRQPGLALSGKVNWLGEADAPLMLELPLYNYLVLGVRTVVRDLDRSGKIVTVLLWGLSFVLLQDILRRIVAERERLWANYLFIIAPLSTYFGQAFLPEMLIQCFSFAFVALALRYCAQTRLLLFVALSLVGLAGMLLKAPEISHLYLFAASLLAVRHGWRSLCRVRYAIALAATLAAMRLWTHELDRVNEAYFPEWTSRGMVQMMVGPPWAHVDPIGYLRVTVYLALLVTTLGGFPLAVWGAYRAWQGRRVEVLAWMAAVAFSYMFWAGSTNRGHSYYNLPALGPACVAFGLACAAWHGLVFRRALIVAVTLLTAVPATLFLYSEDRILEQAAAWLRDHTQPEDLILVRMEHRPDSAGYRHQSTIAYHAQRRVLSIGEFSPQEKQNAREQADWVLVTSQGSAIGPVERMRRWFKRADHPPLDLSWLLSAPSFHKAGEGPGFVVYRKGPVSGNY